MDDLTVEIEKLKKSSIQKSVQKRIAEFEKIGEGGNDRWFSELSYCVLTANSSAELGMKIQERIGVGGFISLPASELEDRIRELGHRFYRTRAEYIVENRRYSDSIKDIVTGFSNSHEARSWLVANVRGSGYKEGSHFLRNVGYKNPVILDRHILRILEKRDVIDCIPRTLTAKRYLSIEKEVEELASRVRLPPAALDLYLWYMETGQILK